MRIAPKLEHFALAAAMLIAGCGAAFAQSIATYPNKLVRVVISFPPGGSIDVIPRIVAQKLHRALGRPG
jgi:tripartite-type tricarboxylate transporter receptor subunit TctC